MDQVAVQKKKRCGERSKVAMWMRRAIETCKRERMAQKSERKMERMCQRQREREKIGKKREQR